MDQINMPLAQSSSQMLSLWKILSRAFVIFKENIEAILIVTLLIYVPLDFISALITPDATAETAFQDTIRYVRIISLFEALIGILVSISIILIVQAAIAGSKINAVTALKNAINKWAAVFTTNLYSGFALMGLFLLFIIPGIVYSCYWAFTTHVTVFHDKKNFESMKYSKELVKGKWWKVFGYFLVWGLIFFGLYFTVAFFILLFPENIFTLVISDICFDVLMAYFTVVVTVFFVNLEAGIPKQPLDIRVA